jgi:putative endonuclease
MSRSRVALGNYGEDVACRELESRGYEILARRYRQRGGEIDIIARDGRTIVFIEVKARDGSDFGDAVEAVTAWKRQRITRMAVDYLARMRLSESPCRFDVVAVHIENDRPVVAVYQNAFDAIAS